MCRGCHLRKTRFDRLLARYLRACRMDWHGALRAWEANREWAAAFLDPFGLELARKECGGLGLQKRRLSGLRARGRSFPDSQVLRVGRR